LEKLDNDQVLNHCLEFAVEAAISILSGSRLLGILDSDLKADPEVQRWAEEFDRNLRLRRTVSIELIEGPKPADFDAKLATESQALKRENDRLAALLQAQIKLKKVELEEQILKKAREEADDN
jgi:hypothetical protein